MNAIFSQRGDKPSAVSGLDGQYWPRMVTPEQVRLALRKLRTDAKMTPEEFADEAQVHRSTVYRIEKMEKDYVPRIDTISALVDSRGLTVTEFFARIEGVAQLTTQGSSGAEPLDSSLDPRSHDFASQLDRRIEAAVDRHLRARQPSESRPGRPQATRTTSGSSRRPRTGRRKTGT